jgi:hypothetical protein
MHRSTPGNPPSDGELCRLAAEVFEALRDAFDVDSVAPGTLGPPLRISPYVPLSEPELAILGMHCAHQLHAVGESPPPIGIGDAIALICTLEMVLRHLLHDRDDESPAIIDLRELHKIVTEVSTLMSLTAALDGWSSDR